MLNLDLLIFQLDGDRAIFVKTADLVFHDTRMQAQQRCKGLFRQYDVVEVHNRFFKYWMVYDRHFRLTVDRYGRVIKVLDKPKPLRISGKQLRIFRLEKQISILSLADACNIQPYQLSRYEREKSNILSQSQIRELVEYLENM